MKTWKLRKFNLFNLMLLCPLLMGVAFLRQSQTTATAQMVRPIPSNKPFVARSYSRQYLNSQPEDHGLAVHHSRPDSAMR
jgi:hypothetical protein